MPFTNPIVGGQTLVIPGVQSLNYVQNVSGWRISRDGSAEFIGVSISGSLTVGNPTGNRVYLKPGPNSFGFGQATLQLFSGSPYETAPGEIFANKDTDTSAGNISVQLWSPGTNYGSQKRASLQMFGADSDTSAAAYLGISGSNLQVGVTESGAILAGVPWTALYVSNAWTTTGASQPVPLNAGLAAYIDVDFGAQTITIKRTGLYLLTLQCNLDASSYTGYITAIWRRNGSDNIANTRTALTGSGYASATAMKAIYLNKGDYLWPLVTHTGDTNWRGGDNESYATVTYLGE